MWTRKDLRKKGRVSFKANYWQCMLVGLIVLLLCSGFSFSPVGTSSIPLTADGLRSLSPAQAVNAVSRYMFGQNLAFWDLLAQMDQSTKGLLATLFNSTSAAGSPVFGVLNTINQFFFNDTISASIVLGVGVVLLFLYWLFVNSILQVGEARFYMENRRYPGSVLTRLFMIYRIHTTRHVAFAMFCRAFFNALWYLTIVGGVIKTYSYRMVPYILAENSKTSWRDALTISRRMMNGQKWRAFLLDLSFLGWDILNLFTFGFLGVLYLNPYKSATGAELYMALRETELANNPATARILCDTALTPEQTLPGATYPVEAHCIPEHTGRQWLAADYHRKYSFTDIVLLFFSFSFVGYVYEVVYYFLLSGTFVNRGTLYGPWLPIYGVGGIAMLVLLRPLINKPIALFFANMALCGAIEYIGAWYLETYRHTKWWDYTGYFLNIHGRVCLEGLLAFAALGMLGIYVLAPSLAHLYDKLPRKARICLCVGLGALFLADLGYSAFHPNMAGAEAMPAAGKAPPLRFEKRAAGRWLGGRG